VKAIQPSLALTSKKLQNESGMPNFATNSLLHRIILPVISRLKVNGKALLQKGGAAEVYIQAGRHDLPLASTGHGTGMANGKRVMTKDLLGNRRQC
jgi:hypothetical protein